MNEKIKTEKIEERIDFTKAYLNSHSLLDSQDQVILKNQIAIMEKIIKIEKTLYIIQNVWMKK